jgi:flagellar FliL protein
LTQTANKAQIDGASLNIDDFAGKAAAKVALDIDDAPFLVEEESKAPEPAPEEISQEELEAQAEARAAALRRRKRLIVFGLSGLIMIVIAVALWYFVLRSVPAEDEIMPGATVIVVPSPASITGPEKIPVTFEDFWVPQKDKAGAVRFLRVHFSTQVIEENFAREIRDKNLTLRDAVYYYLRNKPHEFMLDSANLPVIKQDIADILNGYLTAGKVEDLFLENFLMR